MRRVIPALLILIIPALMAVLSWGFLGAVNTDQPVAALDPARRPLTEAWAQPAHRPARVVLVVLDGLRLDVSESMPTLNELRGAGVDGRSQTCLPSLSRPAYAVIGAGALPDTTGIRNNRYPRPSFVDTVFLRAKEAGLRVRGAANWPWWQENFGASFHDWEVVPEDAAPDKVDAAFRAALGAEAPLTVLHLVDLDRIAHASGVAEEYRRTALTVDARLRALLAQVDLSTSAVIVVSDHGHVDRGGHGGDEPEVIEVPTVMAGRGVRSASGTRDLGSICGLAPTIAELLAIQFPRDGSCPPFEGVLDADVLGGAYLDARRAEWRDHRTRSIRGWLGQVHENWTTEGMDGQVVGNDVSQATVVPSDASLVELEAARRAVIDEIDRDHRLARTPVLAMLLVLLSVTLVVGLLYGARAAPLAALPVLGLAVTGLHWASGAPLTLSAAVTREALAVELGVFALLAFAMYVGALEGAVRVWVPPADQRVARRFHMAFAALVYGAAAPVQWVLVGYALDGALPSPTWFFLPLASGYIGGLWGGLASAYMMAVRSGRTARPSASETQT